MQLLDYRIQCPWCWQPLDVLVDDSIGEQSYVEDCQVCCHPICLWVSLDGAGAINVQARREGEAD